jgi:hypothetical protein
MQENKYFFALFFRIHIFLYLCLPLEASPWYCAIPGGDPTVLGTDSIGRGLGGAGLKKRTAALQSAEPTPPGIDISRWIQTNYQKLGQGLAARRIRDPPQKSNGTGHCCLG